LHRAAGLLCALAVLAATPVQAQPATRGAAAMASDLRAASRQLEALAERVGRSVVEIFTLGYASSDLADAERGLLVAPSRGSGSGVIVDPDGYIVTNAHVVQGAHRIQVELPVTDPPGRSVLGARPRLVGAQLVALDEETDLAVLKVAERGLQALPFGDSDLVRPGQIVLAFGSPLGLNSTVTLGVVSAVARQLEPEDPMIYLQTDAPINPGSSGGPLVNVEGEIVGINTLILSQSGGNEGLGFAAPSNIVRRVFEQIRAYGRVRRGDIGIRAQTITPLLATGLGLSRTSGVILSDVLPDGPAARAGLRIGDVVVRLDGKPMENGRQLLVNLYSRAGETVRLDCERGGQPFSVAVAVSERDDDTARLTALVDPRRHVVPRLGILGLTLDAPLAHLLRVSRARAGVVVAGTSGDVVPGSDDRLRVGDVIHALNGRPVASVEALQEAVAALPVGAAMVLHVERGGVLVFVTLRVES